MRSGLSGLSLSILSAVRIEIGVYELRVRWEVEVPLELGL